ncbi:phosphonate C-P lyase system protein PhnH [Mixta intestinalis]|jgi:alpha-D-ribose 1-methylphosphonate 5-triphosphate synthase subunit PhnH|uniref:Alpha-D-ribose 1-methylphosphonate 5-triphosphate synthase subunit PhnH n=1 Tax=Mixta intestinalis TaxID=1615494 RepID=A0A6P1Q0H9_9GAMM|nr:phosphonate C-P lyase system protein PhnH [Mixta intestinalis]QHM71528.1 Alpha-D-ribose 1-methylphosphonate 5-triphosphate synthase subunit PhnH [Mixta intestinalis]
MSLLASLNRPVVETQPVLRRILKAMNEPGVAVMLPCDEAWEGLSPAATALLSTLNEAEAPLWLDEKLNTPALRACLLQAHAAPLTDKLPAALALLHSDSDPSLATICAPGATVILEVPALNGGLTLRLRGPGIQERRAIAPQLPPQTLAFLREWPMDGQGINLMLTCGEMLMVLPRTAQIEVC